jgi:hypothetical protein
MLNRRSFLKLLGLGLAAPLTQPTPAASDGREVVLATTFIAGFRFHAGMEAQVWARRYPGERLELRREPDNPHDRRAIAVYTAEGAKLGYLPRAFNELPARIADQGVSLAARILQLDEDAPPWERVQIVVCECV